MRRCPTCDGEPDVLEIFGQYIAGCQECEICTRLHFVRDDAIQLWNEIVDEMNSELDEMLRSEQ